MKQLARANYFYCMLSISAHEERVLSRRLGLTFDEVRIMFGEGSDVDADVDSVCEVVVRALDGPAVISVSFSPKPEGTAMRINSTCACDMKHSTFQQRRHHVQGPYKQIASYLNPSDSGAIVCCCFQHGFC